MTPEEIAAGKALFEREWTVNDPLASGDGLGPVFNAKSCAACHFQGGIGGGGTNQHNVTAFEVVPSGKRRKVHAGVVHKFAVSDPLQETREHVEELFPVVANGRQIKSKDGVRLTDLHPVLFDEINTPALFGLGLIDKISDWAIQGHGAKRTLVAISEDFDGLPTLAPLGLARGVEGGVGKFGWRGQFRTLEDFVATACAVELGLSNSHRSQDLPRDHVEDRQAELDINRKQLHQLVSFVRNLPPPREVLPEDPAAREQAVHGKELFSTIGCADCHTPDMGGVSGVYSDFRLYTLESDAYADEDNLDMPLHHPKPSEWKTPPLWGVADSAPYFHDGKSATLEEAILRHNSDARLARNRYDGLPDQDRWALIAFLMTLRAPVLPQPEAQTPAM